MAKPRQFSLAYLFLETFWIAAALGCVLQAMRLPRAWEDLDIALLVLAALFSGAAVGGLFGRMAFGFTCALATVAMFLVAVFLYP